ncbi:thiamine phosphate synthase [Acinetobacter puyangensis]|uniref:8-oxo-dGTP diphosphatase n=1 Tax=Acinetobacter puyangensis TaxID=1096779 RepID=A0A240EBI9_9GAMM|nr:NUDIX domain-containing protein [Acinetobacter puyangensis]SNX45559.1 8-oxo-dGTP diphosphatase [Acinetobacter puyangensis]
MQKVVHVAIGLIVHQGKILVAWRDEQLHQGGCYEFPGGKVEPFEDSRQAVLREIKEEVNIDVNVIKLFHSLQFEYPDRHVKLDFYLCRLIDSAQPAFLRWQWVDLDQLSQLTFPAANDVIVKRLNWARLLAVSPENIGAYQPKNNIELCYLRTSTLPDIKLINQIQAYLPHSKLIVRLEDYLVLDQAVREQVFAIHLNGCQLTQCQNLASYENINVIAACHSAADIDKANQLGCDAVLLSPVLATPSHPEQQGMGWQQFHHLATQAEMPVYALGGMRIEDLPIAQQHAAYGIAGISDFWTN